MPFIIVIYASRQNLQCSFHCLTDGLSKFVIMLLLSIHLLALPLLVILLPFHFVLLPPLVPFLIPNIH